MVDRLGQLALGIEGLGCPNGVDLRGLKELHHSGKPALTTECHAPVVVGEGVVGLEAQGLLEVFERLA
jgi:hypothetical protein